MRPRFHQALLAAIVALLFGFAASGCKVEESKLTPTERTELVRLKLEKAEADAALAAAKTEAERTLALARQAAVEAEVDEFERTYLTSRAGPIFGLLSALPIPGATLLPGLMPLVPLLGKRGRRKFADAMLDLNPWAGKEEGAEKGIAPLEALKDLWAMYGAGHSSKDTAAVAEGKAMAVPTTAPATTG